MKNAREEFEHVMFSCVEDLLKKTGEGAATCLVGRYALLNVLASLTLPAVHPSCQPPPTGIKAKQIGEL